MSHVHPAPLTIAVAQAAPAFLDRTATLEKACELIVDAGRAGARLIVLPAAFIPGYPVWVWTVPPSETGLLNELYGQWLANAVTIPSDVTDRLCRIAQRARINVVIGLNEYEALVGGATCYNTLLYIDARGQLLGKHRSLVLTGAERLVWAQGDGSTLQVHKLPFGTISGLIGGENYLPLARYALYAWGTQIYLAASSEHGEPWRSTLRHIAKEGRVYVIGSGMLLRKEDLPESASCKRFAAPTMETWIHSGDSAILTPDGEFISGPVREQETILYAQIDPQEMSGSKWMLDVAGHDARPDIFQLTVHRERRSIILTEETESAQDGETVL
jgi:nitrilase